MNYLNKICCPSCGKWLLSVSSDALGTIEIFCKRCKCPQVIILQKGGIKKPPMQA